jgi:hypothetical protein
MQLLLEESGPMPNQALAMDSLFLLRDPFPIINPYMFNQPSVKTTRVIIFVTNLQLDPKETAGAIIVNMVSSDNQTYEMRAEAVRVVPGFNFTQVVFPVPLNIAPGTCTIKVIAHGLESNAGTIRIKS